MKGLFRAFERERVEYLLIGGQAAILYGAAHFTQDLDLWIRPTSRNWRAFLSALGRVRARVHKLTPPASLRWVRRGHGFHFLIPQKGRLPAYLDAMGRPPRTGPFGEAARRSRRIDTPWGTLRVVSIEDLVRLKQTNRPGDYEVISRLVRIRLGELRSPSSGQMAWAVRNTFRIEDLTALLSEYGERVRMAAADGNKALARVIRAYQAGEIPSEAALGPAARALDLRMADLLEKGRRHWLPKIADLRALRAKGRLLPAGLPVARLLDE